MKYGDQRYVPVEIRREGTTFIVYYFGLHDHRITGVMTSEELFNQLCHWGKHNGIPREYVEDAYRRFEEKLK